MEGKKTVLITGASRGIGRAVAERLAGRHRLILTGRDEEALASLEAAVAKRGGEAWSIVGDATREEDVRKIVEFAQEKGGGIDSLINNAGMGIFKRTDEFTLEEFEYVQRVNVSGVFLFCKYALPSMIERRSGQIINISSVAGLNGFKTGAAYAASKFAVIGFSESLREDVKQYGIAVTVVCPGGVKTGFGGKDVQQKLMNAEYLLEPEDVARTLEYLVEESETANTKLVELKPRRRREFRA